jgi:chromosome segregation ATPase
MRFQWTPRITLLAIFAGTLIVLLSLITRDFDIEATRSIYYQVEGFETSLEVENSSKIADIYNRLGIQSANIAQLKARIDDYEPTIKQLREREDTVRKNNQESSQEFTKEMGKIMKDNLTLTEDVAAAKSLQEEKDQIKARVEMEKQRERELAAGVEGFYASKEKDEYNKYVEQGMKNLPLEDQIEIVMENIRSGVTSL